MWVYGHEGNAFVRTVVEPLRRIASKLPPRVVYAASVPPALLLHGAAHLYRAVRAKRLPLAAYVSSLADFSFRQNHSIVFDQLIAPTTHYVKRAELERCAGTQFDPELVQVFIAAVHEKHSATVLAGSPPVGAPA